MAAITDHLKSASAEIAKAADVVRQEIDQLRTKDIDLKNMLEKQAVDLAAKANQHEQEAARSDDDNHTDTQSQATTKGRAKAHHRLDPRQAKPVRVAFYPVTQHRAFLAKSGTIPLWQTKL